MKKKNETVNKAAGSKKVGAAPAGSVNDALDLAVNTLRSASPLIAGTVGLDGRPQLRPADFMFEENSALYFLTVKSGRMYAELSKTPYIQFLAADANSIFRLSGKVCFTEDDGIIDRCIAERPEAFRRLGSERKLLIAFFLTGAELEMSGPAAAAAEACGKASGDQGSASVDASDTASDVRTFRLPDPDGVLIGITIKKNTELRDRLSRILERRENEPFKEADELVKLYDGALFVFAEAAKAIWPRMDIQPIERAAVFETWDEREKYTSLAAHLIGNAVIDKPEDMTYWLNIETLKQLHSGEAE